MAETYGINDVFVGPGGELWFVRAILDKDPWSGKPKTVYQFGAAYADHPDRFLADNELQELMKIGIIQFAWSAEEAKQWQA